MSRRLYLKSHKSEIFWFLVPSVCVLIWNITQGTLVNLGPDARLYLSIADNFWQSGHFIQTARDQVNFVVPFGVPLILTIFRGIGLSVTAIIVIQHFILGLTCTILYKSEKMLFCGGLAPLFYCIALLRAQINPNNIYVEYYFLLLLTVIIYLSIRLINPMTNRKSTLVTFLNIAGVYLVACRTVLIPVYIAILIYTFILAIGHKIKWRQLAVLISVPVILFSINTMVNYRETGRLILSDSYSGSDFYAANNPNASTGWYSSSIFDTFGEEYHSVEDNPDLDRSQKNEILKDMAKSWVLHNPLTFLKNTLRKFKEDFIWIWRYVLVVCFVGAVQMIWIMPAQRRWTISTLIVNLIVAFITAMGLVMPRYTIVVWPLASIHLASLGYYLLSCCKKYVMRLKQ